MIVGNLLKAFSSINMSFAGKVGKKYSGLKKAEIIKAKEEARGNASVVWKIL